MIHMHHKRQQSKDLEQINTLYDFPFEAIFDVPEAKEEFRHYLRKEHNEEPFLFYEEVEEYKRLRFEENKAKKAVSILKNFVLPNSKQEINVSSQLRQSVMGQFEQSGQLLNEKNLTVAEEVFDEIQLAVFSQLKRDNYPRFTHSNQFKQFLKNKDSAFITSISVKKKSKYMEYVPQLDGPVCDRDITFFSFMAFNDSLDVWDEILNNHGKRASYQTKKEFYMDDKIELKDHSLEKANGKLLKQVMILPCRKEDAFTSFAHTNLRKEIMELDSINQVDFMPISDTNKYAQSILQIQIKMKGLSWIMKPRDALVSVTSVFDTKRQSYAYIMKSTESTLVPERKSHVRAKILTAVFFSDCPADATIKTYKEFRKSLSSTNLKGSTPSPSEASKSTSTVESHTTPRKSSVSFAETPEDEDESASTESFHSDHHCKVIIVTYADLKTFQSDFVRKGVMKVKNKAVHTNFLNVIKEQSAIGFPKPKFSEGLLETFDAYSEKYLKQKEEVTWDLDDSDDTVSIQDFVQNPESRKSESASVSEALSKIVFQ